MNSFNEVYTSKTVITLPGVDYSFKLEMTVVDAYRVFREIAG